MQCVRIYVFHSAAQKNRRSAETVACFFARSYFERVKESDPMRVEMVYDLAVPDIHCFDLLHIAFGKGKVKDVDVLPYPLFMYRFRDHDDAALYVPAEGDLCRRLVVLFPDRGEGRVGEKVSPPSLNGAHTSGTTP